MHDHRQPTKDWKQDETVSLALSEGSKIHLSAFLKLKEKEAQKALFFLNSILLICTIRHDSSYAFTVPVILFHFLGSRWPKK